MAYLNGQKVLLRTNVNTVTLPIDQSYNPESENAQSGKAVAQALTTVKGSSGTWEKLVDLKTTEEVNSVILTKLEMSKCKEFILRIVYPVTEATLSLGAGYCYLNDYEHPAFRFTTTSTNVSVPTEQRCYINIAEKLVYSMGTKIAMGQAAITGETHTLIGVINISDAIKNFICRLNTNGNNYPVGTQFIVYGKVEG